MKPLKVQRHHISAVLHSAIANQIASISQLNDIKPINVSSFEVSCSGGRSGEWRIPFCRGKWHPFKHRHLLVGHKTGMSAKFEHTESIQHTYDLYK